MGILWHNHCMLVTALTIGTKLPVWKAQQSSPSLWIRATVIRKYFIIASSLRSFGSSNATCTIRWYFVTRARTYGWTCTIRWYFVTRARTYCWSFPFNNDLKIIFKIWSRCAIIKFSFRIESLLIALLPLWKKWNPWSGWKLLWSLSNRWSEHRSHYICSSPSKVSKETGYT